MADRRTDMRRKLAAYAYDARMPDLYTVDGAYDPTAYYAAHAADSDTTSDRAVIRAYLREIRLKASGLGMEIIGDIQIKYRGRIYR